ncbi:MAG: hypothetical protein Q9165_007303 [Trypethelium subeluteriae]
MRTGGYIGIARIDPIEDPGMVSCHAHTIHGGSNFGFNSSYDDMIKSDCTSAAVTQDKSAYWTPTLMFQFTNGTVVTAHEMSFVSYYFLNWPGQNMTGFRANFKMISGDPTRRTMNYPIPDPPRPWTGRDATQDALQSKAIGFNCITQNGSSEASLGRHYLPDKSFLETNCLGGLRLEVQFPQCWDGNNTDSPDHKNQVISGVCTEPGYQVRVPGLFYELLYNVTAFTGHEGQYILSTGDPTGYSLHGDFLMGWTSPTLLSSAVSQCLDPAGLIDNCPLFSINDTAVSSCTMAIPSPIQTDNPTGPRQGLAGGLPVVSSGTPPMPPATPLSRYGAEEAAAGAASASVQTTGAVALGGAVVVPGGLPVVLVGGMEGMGGMQGRRRRHLQRHGEGGRHHF